MTQNEARLRSVAEALASGEYGHSYERLAKHFSGIQTSKADAEIVKRECGAACHWGGNGIGRRMSPELYQEAWSQSDTLALCHDCAPKGVRLYTRDVECFFTWSQIVTEMRRMFKSKSDNVDAFADKTTEPQEARTAKEGETMSHAITKETVAVVLPAQRLQEIEYEIHFHITHAAGHLLEVGRCLNAAKDEGLVPHGQWEEWVEKNAGVGVRTAQRIMAAAREVAADSPLAQLEFSKVRALLALPADEREEFAEEHNADSASVRELEAAIKAKQDAERHAQELQQAIDARDAHYDKKQAELSKKLKVAEAVAAAEAENCRNADQRANDRWRLTIQNLRSELEQARETAPAEGITPEAQANIDRLAGQLAAAQQAMKAQEARLMEQAEKRQEAQNALMALRRQVARGDVTGEPSEGLTPEGLAEATRSFLGKVGTVPHMGRTLAALRPESRDTWEQYIDMVGAWVEGAREALRAVEGVVDLDQ